MDTDGRASRREFLQFLLLWHVCIVGLLAFFYAITAIFQTGPYLIGLGGFLTAILCLVSLLPLGSLCVRRLHDTGRGSMSLLLFLIPLCRALDFACLVMSKGAATGQSIWWCIAAYRHR